ncbi:MAG: hypothetical protein JKX97_01265 [Candidatus Lindowbacteria bacterium]|nr:hypothetical protein [Candidatus Lindowbacteria bacterium]
MSEDEKETIADTSREIVSRAEVNRTAVERALAFPTRGSLFLAGLFYSIIGVIMAGFLAESHTGSLGVCLAGLGLVEITERLFTRHRDLSWSGEKRAEDAATELVGNLMALMSGVLLAFAIYALPLSHENFILRFSVQVRGVFMNLAYDGSGYASIFIYSFKIGMFLLITSAVIGGIYKEAGIALNLTWVGSMWAVGIVNLLPKHGAGAKPMEIALILLTLLCTTVAFFTASSVGLFFARGLNKYKWNSLELKGIVATCGKLACAAVGFMTFSCSLSSLVKVSNKFFSAGF